MYEQKRQFYAAPGGYGLNKMPAIFSRLIGNSKLNLTVNWKIIIFKFLVNLIFV